MIKLASTYSAIGRDCRQATGAYPVVRIHVPLTGYEICIRLHMERLFCCLLISVDFGWGYIMRLTTALVTGVRTDKNKPTVTLKSERQISSSFLFSISSDIEIEVTIHTSVFSCSLVRLSFSTVFQLFTDGQFT